MFYLKLNFMVKIIIIIIVIFFFFTFLFIVLLSDEWSRKDYCCIFFFLTISQSQVFQYSFKVLHFTIFTVN